MKATSITPPIPTDGSCAGKPSANVVNSPVRGSTRVIRPAKGSATNSAPPGPTALPDPPASPVTN